MDKYYGRIPYEVTLETIELSSTLLVTEFLDLSGMVWSLPALYMDENSQTLALGPNYLNESSVNVQLFYPV